MMVEGPWLHPLFLGVGLIAGLISSTPVGPINLVVIERVMKNDTKTMPWFLGGVVGMDALYALLACWGLQALFLNSSWFQGVATLGGLFLVVFSVIGIKQTTRAKRKDRCTDPLPSQSHRFFKDKRILSLLLGLFLCGANPAFLLFWASVIVFISDHIQPPPYPFPLVVSFLAGIIVGDLIWFSALKAVVKKGFQKGPPQKSQGFVFHFRLAVWGIMFLLGLYSLYKHLPQAYSYFMEV